MHPVFLYEHPRGGGAVQEGGTVGAGYRGAVVERVVAVDQVVDCSKPELGDRPDCARPVVGASRHDVLGVLPDARVVNAGDVDVCAIARHELPIGDVGALARVIRTQAGCRENAFISAVSSLSSWVVELRTATRNSS